MTRKQGWVVAILGCGGLGLVFGIAAVAAVAYLWQGRGGGSARRVSHRPRRVLDASPIRPTLRYKHSGPVMGIRADASGNVYALTIDGSVLRIPPSGEVAPVYRGLERCGFSDRVMAVLPGGDVVVNDCEGTQDVVKRIGSDGSAAKLATFKDSVIALAADAQGRVYVGLWMTVGNVTVGDGLQGADNMWGRVVVLADQAAPQRVWEGGLTLALAVSGDGALHGAVWGGKGRFRPSGTFTMCGPKKQFWIGLSKEARIGALEANDVKAHDLGGLEGAAYVALAGEGRLLAFGGTSQDGCGIYRLAPAQPPVKVRFADDTLAHNLTDMTVAGDRFLFADSNGAIFTMSLEDVLEKPFGRAVPTSSAAER